MNPPVFKAYLRDLQHLYNIHDKLEHTVMSDNKRSQLETALEAVHIVLNMYRVDLR